MLAPRTGYGIQRSRWGREREALEAVERIGRDAVAEMQRLLGFLRDEGDEPVRGALPTLQRVGELTAELRAAGLDVQLRLEGDVSHLPPGRALAAFRVVQEALSRCTRFCDRGPVAFDSRTRPPSS